MRGKVVEFDHFKVATIQCPYITHMKSCHILLLKCNYCKTKNIVLMIFNDSRELLCGLHKNLKTGDFVYHQSCRVCNEHRAQTFLGRIDIVR